MQRLTGLLATEASLVWLLHAMSRLFPVDRPNLAVWVRFTPVDEMVMAGFRYIALALGYWLLASTILYCVGLLADLPRLVHSIEWATLPVVKTAARRAMAFTLATSTIAPGAALLAPPSLLNHTLAAADGDPDRDVVDIEPDDVVISVTEAGVIIPPGATVPAPPPELPGPAVATPQLTPPTPLPGAASREVTSTEPTVVAEAPTEYRVEPGDNLWTISAHHLETSQPGTSPSDQEIARYWVRLVALNRNHLTSRNPDRIYPDEIIQLPPIEEPWPLPSTSPNR